MKTTEPIRDINQIRQLVDYYLFKGQIRNYLLAVLCLHTALRIGDILRLTWNDVYDAKQRRMRPVISITEKKTGKDKTVALNRHIITALERYFAAQAPGAALIINERTQKAISRIQAYRILRAAAEVLGFSFPVSCHSLRKTFGYHVWKKGVSPAVIMEIYNHSSLAVTRRYLGVTQDDMNAVYWDLAFTAPDTDIL